MAFLDDDRMQIEILSAESTPSEPRTFRMPIILTKNHADIGSGAKSRSETMHPGCAWSWVEYIQTLPAPGGRGGGRVTTQVGADKKHPRAAGAEVGIQPAGVSNFGDNFRRPEGLLDLETLTSSVAAGAGPSTRPAFVGVLLPRGALGALGLTGVSRAVGTPSVGGVSASGILAFMRFALTGAAGAGADVFATRLRTGFTAAVGSGARSMTGIATAVSSTVGLTPAPADAVALRPRPSRFAIARRCSA